MSRTVLIVEDDPPIREVLQMILESEGYRVALAAGGSDALAQIGAAAPDLVLLDLMLPGMDGLTFAAELRRRGLQYGLPVVVMSAAASAASDAREIGALGYIAKPFDVATLLDRIETALAAGAAA